MRIWLVSHPFSVHPHDRSVFRTGKPTSWPIALHPSQRVQVVLLDVLAPPTLRSESVRRVTLFALLAERVKGHDLLITVVPFALESVARRHRPVDLGDVQLERLEIVQFGLAVSPLALERLVLGHAACDAWGARVDTDGLIARTCVVQSTRLLRRGLAFWAVQSSSRTMDRFAPAYRTTLLLG